MKQAQRESGLTLIELSLVLIILGFLAVLGWRLAVLADEKQRLLAAPPLLDRAEQALTSYASLHSRLPCPDQDGDGREDCGGGEIGTLPWHTLQLGDRELYRIRYGVFQAPHLNLTRAEDRFVPLSTPVLPPAVKEEPLGNVTRLDLCYSLQQAQARPLDPAHLHLLDAAGRPSRNLAYTLSIAGESTSTEPTAEQPATGPRAHAEAGWVRAGEFAQLYREMYCSELLSAAGHTYPNLAMAAAIMTQAEKDYLLLLELLADLAHANALLAGAGVAKAAGGVADGVTELSLSIAKVLIEMGSTAGVKLAPPLVSIAGSAASSVLAATATGFADAAHQRAEKIVDEFKPVLDEMKQLHQSVENHAEQADAFQLY